MIIIMKNNATEKQKKRLISALEKKRCSFKMYCGGIIAITQGKPPSREKLKAMPFVEEVTKTI